MFPDPTLRWHPYPSIMDGIKNPFVLDRGLWGGVLNLIVTGSGSRAYGVEIECHAYGAFEEMMYSIADHADESWMHGGDVYIKETDNSKLLDALRSSHPMYQKARQFLFVGGDFCYETIGFAEPVVRKFASEEEAYAWAPGRDL